MLFVVWLLLRLLFFQALGLFNCWNSSRARRWNTVLWAAAIIASHDFVMDSSTYVPPGPGTPIVRSLEASGLQAL